MTAGSRSLPGCEFMASQHGCRTDCAGVCYWVPQYAGVCTAPLYHTSMIHAGALFYLWAECSKRNVGKYILQPVTGHHQACSSPAIHGSNVAHTHQRHTMRATLG
jgi:hypothetical protein